MAEERRFKEEEIRAIFQAATESPDFTGSPDSTESTIPTGGDLTLRDLQEIGMEVGIRPEEITAAARALDKRQEVAPRRTYLGMPISVGRTVDLPRAPTDREWTILVSELRETFRARGKVVSHGDLREWTNGNLHASVEPTETGYRLRLGTLKTSAVPTVTAGRGSRVRRRHAQRSAGERTSPRVVRRTRPSAGVRRDGNGTRSFPAAGLGARTREADGAHRGSCANAYRVGPGTSERA